LSRIHSRHPSTTPKQTVENGIAAHQTFLRGRYWREHGRPEQLAREPWCEHCKFMSRQTRATEVDHILIARDDRRLQRMTENLQSLCGSCHDAKTHWERRPGNHPLVLGIEEGGWRIVLTHGCADEKWIALQRAIAHGPVIA
jgi:5-methylcytosine-specific restriction endonuclease McrA